MTETQENTNSGNDLEEKIINILKQQPKGASNEDIFKAIPSMNKADFVDTLNKLLGTAKIEVLKKGKRMLYKLKGPTLAGTLKCSGVEEKVVFEAIANVGNKGILSQSLARNVKLNAAKLKCILTSLEKKNLIKCVISTTKKKLFMLSELDPDATITGGVFYNGQDFDSELVRVVGEECYKYLNKSKTASENLGDPIAQRNASRKSSKDICDYINSLKITTMGLSVQEIEKIMEAIMYDGKVEKNVSFSGYSSKNENLYRISKPIVENADVMKMPCGVCKVIQNCHEFGEISPSSCVYMKEWLNW